MFVVVDWTFSWLSNISPRLRSLHIICSLRTALILSYSQQRKANNVNALSQMQLSNSA
jgi:hypothetical protein